MFKKHGKLIASDLFGFTLIEVVMAIGIFSIASVIISSVYLNANRLHQATANFQRLQNEGRYIMEKVTREIRAREVEYPVEFITPQEYLGFLEDETGDRIRIEKDGFNLKYSVNGEVANLNADDIEVIDAKFYVVSTKENKWGSDPETNIHPRVTFLLRLRNKAVNLRFQREIAIQTTISSKLYKR